MSLINYKMDIDDLLAEVAVTSVPQETRDLQELTRCWVAERTAPEILPWPSELMDRALERIRKQVRWPKVSTVRELKRVDQKEVRSSADYVARLNWSKTKRATWIQRLISS